MASPRTAEEAISPQTLPQTDTFPDERDKTRNPNDVFWDSNDDQLNPMNWTVVYRWSHIVIITLVTFVMSLGSSMLAPAVSEVMKSLHSHNSELESFVISVYVIGFAVGPLLVAPLSEVYGRAIVYNVSNVIFLLATIGCALSTNVGMFIVFRLICGCAGATPLALGGGSISDLMKPERMGAAMAIWGLGSLLPPVFSPIAGGYLGQYVGWRWIFWVNAIPMAILTGIFPFLIRETYTPVLLERKARRLRKETGNPHLKSRLDRQLSQKELLLDTFIRPPRILFTSHIVTLLGIRHSHSIWLPVPSLYNAIIHLPRPVPSINESFGAYLFGQWNRNSPGNFCHRIRIRQNHRAKKSESSGPK